MRSRAVVLLASLLLVQSQSGVAFAQTADDVVEKHLAALGGRDVLSKLTSRKSTGTVTLTTPAGPISGPYETYAKGPNKARAYMKLDLTSLGAGEMIAEQRFDGTTGYMLNSLQGDSPASGNMLENMRNNVFPSPLLSYKQNGTKVELLPPEKIGDRDAIVLLVTPKSGSVVRIFLDAATYLIARTVTKVESPQLGQTIEQTSNLSDYRVVDGIKVAFQVVNTNPLQSLTIKLTKVEHNVVLEDAMFEKK